MATVQVRYIVIDVDAAIAFYTGLLDFTLEMHPAPAFAMLSVRISASSSARPIPPAAAGKRCLTAPSLSLAAGIGLR